MDGLQVLDALARGGVDWPVIVMTGHGEVAVAVRAMKLGAVDFLEKPFGEDILMAALDRAFALIAERGEASERRRKAKAKMAVLSRREEEILRGLLAGLPNKVLARRLDISLRTVEMHRANMMTRLGAESLAEALMVAIVAGVEPLGPELAEKLRA
jgi:two-component system response regulator FixJ